MALAQQMLPAMPPAMPAAPALPPPTNLDSQEIILERRKEHLDEQHREIVYGLRRVAADQLDITTTASIEKPTRTDGKYADWLKNHWEEGRHNSIRVNTHLQAKALVFNEPEIKWRNCKVQDPAEDDLISKIRNAYYLNLWRSQRLADTYRLKLLDMLVSGEGNIACWKIDNGLAVEYLDSLDVTWDPSYKEPHKRRYVYVDRHMPMTDALSRFPGLNKYITPPAPGKSGGEKNCTLTLYYSKTTYAVLYKTNFVQVPIPNPLNRIPVRVSELFRELSTKFATGMVELQIGTHKLDLRIQRALREIALRCLPVGVLTGQWEEDAVTDLEDAEEAVIIRSLTPSAGFSWAPAAELPATLLEVQAMVNQQMNAESGTNDFQRGQTDTKVDFASQLAYIAQQSGVLGRYAAQQHEDGIREDAAMIMEIAAMIEEGPLTLVIDGHQIDFDQLTPIKPLLGGDGDIILTPGGMEYKSPAQKIQEWMVLTEALGQATLLPPGIREHIMEATLKAFDVDNADEWIAEMQQAEMQQQMMQAQMAMAQQPQQGGIPGPKVVQPNNKPGQIPGPKVQTPQSIVKGNA